MELESRLYYSFDYRNAEFKPDWEETISNICLYFLRTAHNNYKVIKVATGESVEKTNRLAICLFAGFLAFTIFIPFTLAGLALLNDSKSHSKSYQQMKAKILENEVEIPDFVNSPALFNFYNQHKNNPQVIERAIQKILNLNGDLKNQYITEVFNYIRKDNQLDRYTHIMHQHFNQAASFEDKMKSMELFSQFFLPVKDLFKGHKTPCDKEDIAQILDKCLGVFGLWTPEILASYFYSQNKLEERSLALLCYIYFVDELNGRSIPNFQPYYQLFEEYIKIHERPRPIINRETFLVYLTSEKPNKEGTEIYKIKVNEIFDIFSTLVKILSPANYAKIVKGIRFVDQDTVDSILFLIVRQVQYCQLPEDKEKVRSIFRAILAFDFENWMDYNLFEDFLNFFFEHLKPVLVNKADHILGILYEELCSLETYDRVEKPIFKEKAINHLKKLAKANFPQEFTKVLSERVEMAKDIKKTVKTLYNHLAPTIMEYIGTEEIEEFATL